VSVIESQPFYRSSSWRRQTGSAGVAYVSGSVLAMLASITAARSLGPGNFGAVVLATSTVAAIATFLDFSLEEAVIHHGAALEAQGDAAALRALLFTSLRLDLAVGAIVMASLLVIAGPVASVVSQGSLAPLFIRIACLETFAATVNGTTGATLMLAGRPALRAWSFAYSNAARFAAVLIAIRVVHGGSEGVLWAFVSGTAAGAAMQAALAASIARGRWRGGRSVRAPVPVRALALFGLHSSAATTVLALQGGVVAALLGRGAGPSAVGLVSVASLPLTLSSVGTAALRLTAFAEQARLVAEGRVADLRRAIFGFTVAAGGFAAVAATIGWFLLPWLLTHLYSGAFADAVAPSRVLLLAASATLATAWTKALPAVLGRPALRTLMVSLELLILVGLMIAFGHRDAERAAWAISLSSAVSAVTWVGIARRILDRRPRTEGSM